jgi:hypothetical protein
MVFIYVRTMVPSSLKQMKVTVTEPNRRGISVDTIPWVEAHEPVKQWMKAIQENRTSWRYAYALKGLMRGISKEPKQLLTDLETNPKENSIIIKSYIGSLKSRAAARSQLSALRSFCGFHEVELKLNGLKVRVPRTRKKPYLAWNDAEKIIAETRPPYRDVFRFLMRSGLGLDEFAEIQGSAEIQASIMKQLGDANKHYVRIDLRPRKGNTDVYYTLVQRAFVPHFPIHTKDYGSRGNQLATGLDLELNWFRARKRLGLGDQVGLGPHTLRSVFRSQCGLLGVSDAVAEFCMGHGGRERYGYSREMENESYVVGELSKLWNANVATTTRDLEERDAKIRQLETQVQEIRGALAEEFRKWSPAQLEDLAKQLRSQRKK